MKYLTQQKIKGEFVNYIHSGGAPVISRAVNTGPHTDRHFP